MATRLKVQVQRARSARLVKALDATRELHEEHFPLLVLFFVGSGFAALIYEIVWFQLLQLSIGSSAVSIAVLLGTFMGGMCLGSLGLSRVIGPERHPLRVYGLIESGIGLCALVILWLLPYVGGAYLEVGGVGVNGLVLRAVICVVFLLPPTVLMGATLPAVSRWVKGTRRGVSWLGFLYGANTLGAVAGTLFASFYLLRLFDVAVATFVAVSVNAIIAAAAIWLSRTAGHEPASERSAAKTARGAPPVWPTFVTIGLSGFTALSAEVVWTRLLSYQLSTTVYTFSLILAAILLGIGLGGYVGSWLIRSKADPRLLLGGCQALLTGGIAWSAYLLMSVLPFQRDEALVSPIPELAFQHGLARALAVVTPAALLWGASFTIAIAAATRRGRDEGGTVGRVYAANTLGAVLGSLLTSLVAMPNLGSQRIQQLLIVLAAMSALVTLVPLAVEWLQERRAALRRAGSLIVAPPLAAALLVFTVQPVPPSLVAWGPGAAWDLPSYGTWLYVGEGMNSSLAIQRQWNGTVMYFNAGKPMASSDPRDLRLQRMLGHLTTLQMDTPESVLVLGCGAGVTAGAISIDPRVKRLTVVDIEPLVPLAAQTYFSEYNEGVITNPKTTVVIDDGRHFLMTSDEKYDAISIDIFDLFVKGAASLSTVEFYQSLREHLKPGGVVTLWAGLYQVTSDTAKSEIATFKQVFPDVVVWDNVTNSIGDIVISGRVDGAPIDVDAVEARIAQPEYERVRASLASVGFSSATDLFATFGAQGDDMDAWLEGAQINRDRNLRLQYLAGLGVFTDQADAIYQAMTRNRTWPESLFTGSPERLAALKQKAGF